MGKPSVSVALAVILIEFKGYILGMMSGLMIDIARDLLGQD